MDLHGSLQARPTEIAFVDEAVVEFDCDAFASFLTPQAGVRVMPLR